MDTLIAGRHTVKNHSTSDESNASTKSLVDRLCGLKIYAISLLIFIGSVCAPDKATIKAENHAIQCTTAGLYNAFPTSL